MPNQRASGQILIGCHVDATFAAQIDRARQGKSRSDFLREALFEHLLELGYQVPEILKFAPDRTGKGGPRRVVPMPGMQMPGARVADSAEPASAEATAERKKVSYKVANKKPRI
jgi:hypothetical protein